MAGKVRTALRLGASVAAFASVFATPGVFHPGSTAHADLFFCEDDPVISVNGVDVDITVGIEAAGVHAVEGNVPIVVVVPDGMPAYEVSQTNTYFHEKVHVVQRGELDAVHGLPNFDAAALRAAVAASVGQSQVLVFSEFHTQGSFSAEINAARQSPKQVYRSFTGTSNNLMAITFSVPAR